MYDSLANSPEVLQLRGFLFPGEENRMTDDEYEQLMLDMYADLEPILLDDEDDEEDDEDEDIDYLAITRDIANS
jgi:hypothetical protein